MGPEAKEAVAERRSGRDRRRERQRGFRWSERRSGFDERQRYPITGGLRDNLPVLVALLVALNVLNAFDLVMTYEALERGAVEGNPFMRIMLSGTPGLDIAFKVGTMAVVSTGVFFLRRYRWILAVAVAAMVLYAVVAIYHITALAFLA